MRAARPALVSTCDRKIRYATWDEAEAAAMEMYRRGKNVTFAYRCDVCAAWHLTHWQANRLNGKMAWREGCGDQFYAIVMTVADQMACWAKGLDPVVSERRLAWRDRAA